MDVFFHYILHLHHHHHHHHDHDHEPSTINNSQS
jgi:hypothetical protein